MDHHFISWIARNNDFVDLGGQRQLNPQGPTLQFHEHFFRPGNYSDHLLLYSSPDQKKDAVQLADEIIERFGHKVVPTLLELKDVIDVNAIRSRVETWLQQYADHELTLYFSPGTSAMQLAWYLVHLQGVLRTHLVQTRAAKYSESGKPEVLTIKVERTSTPVTAILREQQLHLASSGPENQSSDYFIGDALRPIYERARKVAQTDKVTVLIRGESGTGKEHLARYVHEQSGRAGKPFLPINCSALTDSTLESRLFGYCKGAFTGAEKNTKGLFEEAHGGTLFLDEIGDISVALQLTLLRVMQSGEIQPMGGNPRTVDVRVIAATNTALEERCRAGQFRWDLFYRLAVAELELPALRDRPRADREQLLDWMTAFKSRQLRHEPLRLAANTRRQLLDYYFPGNVRELESVMEHLLVFSEPGATVELADLPTRIKASTVAGDSSSLLLEDAIRQHVCRVLAHCGGIKRRAATLLGVEERTVRKYYLLSEFNPPSSPQKKTVRADS
ncbi:sigma 54-interacting transcriptional regulator [Hymenobacter sp. 5414T-23]|uniref:sigma 54-interacting transcriptional regulator n=1 Tax=Hymenobacter sp. 5414T-23 TaxID=2932252 RepID=UPI001FD2D54A|nr:sigma-54 dependent transcriptional regulator [Hymenobacter sp. 5414T-23]UOQ83261.1 sigma-54 dependent transcriptional regulator [Hymenobacter sp. 5414T-23]